MDDKRSIMEAEMNRFEAEIGGGVPTHFHSIRPVIGANTYNKVQQQLNEQHKLFMPLMPPTPEAMARLGGIPPPPPPPNMMIPHQVHRPQMMMIRPPMNERPRAPIVPAIVSATPKLYMPPVMLPAKPVETPSKKKKKGKQVMPQIITPPANVGPSFSLEELGPKRSKERNKAERSDKGGKKIVRTAGGQTWEDTSLLDWAEDDFRIFCGDLGNDVTDEVLTRAFNRFPSFQKAKVVRDKRTNKTKGFGFVSFKDPQDFINAMKEMNGRYVGSRPIKLRKSMWKNRNVDVVRKRDKERSQLIGLLTGR